MKLSTLSCKTLALASLVALSATAHAEHLTVMTSGGFTAAYKALSPGYAADSGDTVITKIEQRIGDQFALPKDFAQIASPELGADPSLQITPGAKRVKLAVFWDEMKGRASWMKVYRDGLH